jgi:aminopeptidase
LPDARAQRLAQVLVRYSTEVAPGELCSIEGESPAEELIEALYEEVLHAGAHPVVLMTPARAQAAFFELASEQQLEHVSPVARQLTEQADVRIRVLASANPRELSAVDPQRQVRRQRASAELMERLMARSAAGELRWALCQYPTAGYAAEAELSLAAYEDFLYGACLCDRDDPVAAWRAQAAEVNRLAQWIEGREEVHIQAPGTDLRLVIAGRHFIAADGKRNMPDGEFFTGPVEDSAQGTIAFHLPTTYGGREVAGVTLRFEDGVVVDAGAERRRGAAARDARLRPRRAAPRRARDRDQLRDRARHTLDSLRREDRRHRAPGAWALLPGDRWRQRVLAALGHDL